MCPPYRVKRSPASCYWFAAVSPVRTVRGEPAGAVTEVGTAHRSRGREFPVVVFDLVDVDRVLTPGEYARNGRTAGERGDHPGTGPAAPDCQPTAGSFEKVISL
jgi:hypothetical protein